MVAQMNLYSSNKRPRPDSPSAIQIPSNQYSNQEPTPSSVPSASAHGAGASSFRNVSACNRCRLRKNRCDQNLPACSSCEKAKVKCVGFDPITKREIPRAYVYYLESRVSYLEELLSSRGIAFAPAEDFEAGTSKHADSTTVLPPQVERQQPASVKAATAEQNRKQEEAEKLNKLVSNIGLVSVQGASDPRYLGSTSGISFARVVFAAVRSSISGSTSDRAGVRSSKMYGPAALQGPNATSMRDSFFGLQSKPAFKKAPFPDRELGARLVNLYFEIANPQTPILHRGEFMALFDRTYASDERRRTPRELYMLNIVFAIGAGVIYGGSSPNGSQASSASEIKQETETPEMKRARLASKQHQPEEYHASAMFHLEYFLSSMPTAERPEGFGGSLEELQAVLLLAGFALLRPVAPGLWYIVGVAVRLAVDLGLHYEDGTGIEDGLSNAALANRSQDIALEAAGVRPTQIDPREKGRRQWIRDLRRRLWWCVYSFDRLVSTCVGRPFGVTDQVITTAFPSILDDNYITTSGFTAPPGAEGDPSYKRAAIHYFKLRLLQSEILQVLQHRQARQARARSRNPANEYMHSKLPSPFLEGFESFWQWRADIDRRLWEWKETMPSQKEVSVTLFNTLFLELNYWQAVIMLYRQGLTAPVELGNEPSPSDEVASPLEVHTEPEDDDEIFMKVATAGQKVLKLYYQLHRLHVVNYTFLATHHLFMAGIAFLYAIWHSPTVRNCLSIDDVDYTVLAATTVLGSLSEKCPPAETCRDAFERMAKATVSMVLRTTGFGNRAPLLGVPKPKRPRSTSPHSRNTSTNSTASTNLHHYVPPQTQTTYFPTAQDYPPYQPPPSSRFQLEPNLRELFPEDTPESQRFRTVRWGVGAPRQVQQHTQHQSHSQLPSYHPTPMHSPASPAVSVGSAADTSAPHLREQTPQTSLAQLTQQQPPPPQTPQQQTNSYPHIPSSASQLPTTPSTYTYMTEATPTIQPATPLGPGQHMQAPSTYGPLGNGVSVAAPGYEDRPGAIGFQNELDFLLSDPVAAQGAYVDNAGMSLGFETDHDFNDGGAPDLFEGYWFRSGWGSVSGIGGMMGNGMGMGGAMDGVQMNGDESGTPDAQRGDGGMGILGQGMMWDGPMKMER